MKTENNCIPCLIRQGQKMSEYLNLSKESKEEIAKKVDEVLNDCETNATPPDLAKKIYREIYKITGNNNPYKEIKSYFNKEMLKNENELENIIENSNDKFLSAMKLAITGNIIDFGPKHEITKEMVLKKVYEAENASLVIDRSNELYNKLKESKKLLYIGDNCGEIVFDKVFINYMKKEFPLLEITFAVRGKPAINDITIDDAIETGIDKIVKIIDNGDDAPGTIIEDVKDEFREIFYNSDIIISKGQGNYETLNDIDRENVFFLFMAKCDVIAGKLNVNKMSLVCTD